MATVLGLAMKITADASGLAESLTPADKALRSLGERANAAAGLFDKFAQTTTGAIAAQQKVATDLGFLTSALKTGQISAQEFAAEFAEIQRQAQTTAQVFADGVATTSRYKTEQEQAAQKTAALNEQLRLGAISQETYQRAIADVSGENERAARAEEERAKVLAAGSATTNKYKSEQEKVSEQLSLLTEQLNAGAISQETYQRAVADVSGENERAARVQEERNKALAAGAATTEKYKTEQEKVAETLAVLSEQLKSGAISQETYRRAVADVSGENDRAAKAEQERAKYLARAAELTRSVMTPAEQYGEKLRELNGHLQAGTISQEVYDKNLQKIREEFNKNYAAVQQYGKATDAAGKSSQLAFNELSGILAAIPGPIGNIAGRLSGLSSAAEGLGRIFAGGLSQGVSGLATSFASLVNPTTLAVAGVAAVGAAAVGITNGLSNLASKVESLSLLAQRLGTSFDFVQVLEEAAARSGGSVDQLAGAMQRFATRVDEARGGTGKAAEAFQQLGISQEQLISSSPVEIATQTALALQKIEDPAKRAALATETLGKQGLELVPAFASLGEAQAAMERFSAAISDIDASRLNSLDDSFDDVGTALRGLGQNLLTPFAGLADGVASAIADSIAAVTKAIDPLLNAITPILDGVGLAFEALGEVIFTVGDSAGKVFTLFGDTVGRVANIVGAAAAALGQGISEAVGTFLEFTGLGDVISALADTVSNAFSAIVGTIGDAISSVSGFVDGVLSWAENWLGIKSDVEEPIVVDVDTSSLEDATAASESLQKVLDQVHKNLNDAINESAEFGQAGFDAAYQYQEALKRLREQFDAGILNEEAYKRAIDAATASYSAQINEIKKVAEEAEKRAAAEQAAAQKIIDENKKISDALLEQLRIEQEFGGDNARARAAENVKAIEQEIARVQEEQRLANEQGRTADAEASAKRLGQLDQVLAREQDIASGAADRRKKDEEAAQKLAEMAEKAAEEQAKRDEARRQKLEEYANQINEIEAALAEKRFEIDKARLEELSKVRGGAINIGDFREGGSDVFLDLLAGKQDDAIEEYRNQLRELKALRKDIQKLEIKKAEILGGVG